MRVLHVSDLHFGRSLGDLSREPEQRALVPEVVLAARELDVSLTIISGDVYDAYTPPAWAEDLFFSLLDGLADGGRRAVAVIAGNHDSGLRLAAAAPLARRLGIVLAGDMNDAIEGFEGRGDAVRTASIGRQIVRIEVPRAEAPIVMGLLPFVSEARIPREEETHESGDDSALRYAAYLASELAARASLGDERSVNLLALHQYVTGGIPTESERRLRIGAISDIDAAAIPGGLHYVAIGHLHRPQEIVGSASRAHYAGSPIAYSFSEVGQIKRAMLIDAVPGRDARLTSIPLTSGRPLEIWTAASIEEALAIAKKNEERRCIVEVRARFGRRLAPAEGDALMALPGATVVAVRDEFDAPASSSGLVPEVTELAVEDLFKELWQRKHGDAPDGETMLELASALLEVGQGSDEDAPPS